MKKKTFSVLTAFFILLQMLLILDCWIMRGKHNPGSGLAERFFFYLDAFLSAVAVFVL